jgi:hypothetical protein
MKVSISQDQLEQLNEDGQFTDSTVGFGELTVNVAGYDGE